MIKMCDMLTETKRPDVDKGCLMALIENPFCDSLIKFGKKIIPNDEDLYTDEPGFGRELECHVTILYGFIKDLSELDARRILKDTKPFTVKVTALDKFGTPPNYDVIKLNVESSELIRLNEICKQFPYESDFPSYNPHITLAYTKKGKFNHPAIPINLEIPINTVFYSPMQKGGSKSYYKL